MWMQALGPRLCSGSRSTPSRPTAHAFAGAVSSLLFWSARVQHWTSSSCASASAHSFPVWSTRGVFLLSPVSLLAGCTCRRKCAVCSGHAVSTAPISSSPVSARRARAQLEHLPAEHGEASAGVDREERLHAGRRRARGRGGGSRQSLKSRRRHSSWPRTGPQPLERQQALASTLTRVSPPRMVQAPRAGARGAVARAHAARVDNAHEVRLTDLRARVRVRCEDGADLPLHAGLPLRWRQ